MNRKQFLLVSFALAVVGSAGLILINQNKETWSPHEARMGDNILPHFQFNDVAAIHVKGASELNVVRTDGVWRVLERSGYAADYQQIRGLLMKIGDLKVVQSERIGPSQLGRVDLDEPGKAAGGGTLVQFINAKGKVLDSMLVGKKHLRPQDASAPVGLHGLYDGRYILLPSDPGNVLLISDELAGITLEPDSWLSRNFFKIEHIKSISLVLTNGVNAWTLLRENESWPWKLADADTGEAINATAASQLAEIPGFLGFIDILPNATPAETGLDKPIIVFIETFDRIFYTLKIGATRRDGNYCMSVDVKLDLPTKRAAAPDETGDDRKRLDAEFQDKTKTLRDKIAKEQALATWVYAVDRRLMEAVIRDRAQLLEKKTIVGQQSTAPAVTAAARSE